MQEKEFKLEQDWLDLVYREIDDQLAQQEKQTRDYHSQMQEIRVSLWEDHGISSASANRLMDVAQQIAELRHSATSFGIQHRLLKQLQTAQKAPYFGRMDFHEEGLPVKERMYIGIRSLIDHKTNLPLVYDWRAPVSSMFYDYGLGPAEYEGPGGTYRGEISLKRQYKIKDRKLVYMFDNELTIDDEVLQDALGQHADEKMRTIVNTIQREQNQAIRNVRDDLLLVEGPAGSGKTSVALHRVAYLLYKYRDIIQSQNIVIFSPNRIFSDYISHVLPELGEENVHQTTWQDFLEPFLGWEWNIETQSSYLESLLREEGMTRDRHLNTLVFKSSPTFQKVLDSFVDWIIGEACDFSDVYIGEQLVITAREQERLFSMNYSYLPAQKRLAKIHQRILFLLRPIKKSRIQKLLKGINREDSLEGESWWTLARQAVQSVQRELEPLLTQLDSQLKIDYMQWYRSLWTDESLWRQVAGKVEKPQFGHQSLGTLQTGWISFEDAVPLAYLKGELEGYPAKRVIQHVVVDEAQDYAPLQLRVIIKTFPRARFTFLGDIFQSLHPYLWQTKDTLAAVFGDLEPQTIKLNKSYRSTEEIFYFCSGLLGGEVQAETVLRHGMKPTVCQVAKGGHITKLHDLIMDMERGGMKTIAVICETVSECKAIFDGLREHNPNLELSLLTHERATFKPGILIVPVFLGKGLEFDAVIVPDVSADKYGEEFQRRLLYVACSRALHSLHLIHAGQETLSPFLRDLPSELYNLE